MAPTPVPAATAVRPARWGGRVAACLLLPTLGLSAAAAQTSGPGLPERPALVTAVRRPEGATVRWQAKVKVPDGAFRLYLTDTTVRRALVAQFPASTGKHLYQFRGVQTPDEVADLHLAFVNPDGREVELAVLVLRLVNMGSDDTPNASPPNRAAALVPASVELHGERGSPQGAETRLAMPRAWRAPPPTPPPEVA
jgi:hypothetical protein